MISRRTRLLTPVALTASLSTTQEIDNGHEAGDMIYVPSGSSITSLTFYVASKLGGTYMPLNTIVDQTQNPMTAVPVVMTVSGPNAYPWPDACFGAPAVKIEAGGGNGSVDITSKS